MKKTYKTRDIYLAAILLALGAKLEGTDKSDLRHQEFKFSSDAPGVSEKDGHLSITVGIDFQKVETEYANATLMINAVKFKDAIQRMKGIIHSA